MRSYGKVENTSAVVCQHDKHIQDLKPNRRPVKKSTETMLFTWFSRKLFRSARAAFSDE